jgi:flavin reductase (DIM6/NTAB) family NADH-FMN oxidoreductase RutF
MDTEEFDRFAAGLDYPMFVVTTTDGSERSGCLVGFTTQASIDPPRMLVCLSRANHTFGVAERAELLAVHVVEEDQHELTELFGGSTGDEVDKFDRCSWHAGPGGVPLLDDCPQYVVGRVLERLPFGDHTGYLLDPVEVGRCAPSPADPITLEQVGDVSPGHEA